ncbi:beta-galactosidase [Candidatus Leptofilum sp.]|uniref:beta-galactosidase n=1 Tax=Candidatus Leptofilum sp. TaxID=3241576 RepID=UPI003B5A77CB
MKFGVCYYPEHWPEERWAEDARLMNELGLKIIRMAEFAWAKVEPEPDVYNWGWLDRAIALFANAGMEVVLGTPTCTPPAWLTRQHPEILRVDANGRSRNHGTRRHTCPNSPVYREYSRQIVTQMGLRYGQDARVVGWQIDNEFGGGKSARCYCNDCAREFRIWLEGKYGTLDALNAAWGTIFWSQTYTDWSHINPPGDDINYKNPSHLLDFYRFSSDTYVSYQQEQIDLLHQLSPGRFITHNFMGLYLDLDQFDLAKPLDFITWDNYPTGNPDRWRQILYPPDADVSRNDPVYAYDMGDPILQSMAHALMRGLKQRPFWIMEQQCGHINWGSLNPGVRPGTPRLWIWHAVAEGADHIIYFRWRATLMAQEQYHSGLLGHDGRPDVGFRDQKKLLTEMEQLSQLTAAPLDASVAIIFNYDDLWTLQTVPHRQDFHYLRHLFAYYYACLRLGINVDLVPNTADPSRYKLVIAPTAHLADEALAQRLHTYASGGGTLLLGVRSGFKTPSGLVTDQPLPGALRELAGVTVTSWQSLPLSQSVPFSSEIENFAGEATYWIETLALETAVPLATYELERPDNFFGNLSGLGKPTALAENTVGNGRVLTLGFYPTQAQARTLLQHLASQLNIETMPDLPAGVLALQRGDARLLLNFTDAPQTVNLGTHSHTLPPRDLIVYH